MTPEERAQFVSDVSKAVVESLNIGEVVKSVVAEQLKPIQEDVAKSKEVTDTIAKFIPESKHIEGQEQIEKSAEDAFWDIKE